MALMSSKSNYANVNQNEVLLQIQSESVYTCTGYAPAPWDVKNTLDTYTTIKKILFGDNTPRHLQAVFISYAWRASLNYMNVL